MLHTSKAVMNKATWVFLFVLFLPFVAHANEGKIVKCTYGEGTIEFNAVGCEANVVKMEVKDISVKERSAREVVVRTGQSGRDSVTVRY